MSGGLLETAVERIDSSNVKISVMVPADVVDATIAKTYKRVANEVKIPGFRKGHAPPRVIDNLVGRERVMIEAQEALVNETYTAALDSQELRPIDEPDMGELDLPVEGEAYAYDVEVAVRPELVLTSHDDLTVTVPPVEASNAEVDKEIDRLRDRLATLEVADRGIEPGDYAVISFTGLVDGEEYEGNSAEDLLYEFGAGRMPDEFEQQLMGAVAGEDRKVAFVIEKGTANYQYVGKEASFDVRVHEVKRKVLPEVDDEFALSAGGYDDVDDMREQVRAEIEERKSSTHMNVVEVEARRALIERLEGDVPEAMVRRRTDDLIRDFFNRLESQGITPEQYSAQTGDNLETLSQELEGMAYESVATDLALEALFRVLEMELTEDDIEAEMRELVGSEGDPDQMRDRFENAGLMQVIAEQAMHRKATRWMLDHVTVIERRPGEGLEDDLEDPGDAGAEASGEE